MAAIWIARDGAPWIEHTAAWLYNRGLRKAANALFRFASRLRVHDPCTGLLTRRTFFRRLDRFLAAGGTGSLLIADVDRMKHLNDLLGFDDGDRYLRLLATAVRTEAQGCPVGRLGGDELIAYIADQTQAEAIAERIRAAVDINLEIQAMRRCMGPGPRRLTLSIGIARIAPGATRKDVFRAADEAVWRAKDAGGNRVVIAASPPCP